MRNVTLKRIAEKAGVSKTTVSYVFSNHPDVGSETRKKVLKIARRFDYQPNHFARALNTGRTKTIGVVFTNALGVFMGEIIKGIEKVIYEHGYHILLSTCNDDQEREKSHIEILLHKGVDGLIIFFVTPKRGEKFDYSHLLNLKKRKIPLVFIDRYLPGEDIDYVVTDDFAGAYEAVTRLISLGHRRIAYINKQDDCTSVKNRLEGYRQALVDAGIEVRQEYIKTIDFPGEGFAYKATEQFLRMKDEPTAIFAVTDSEAIEAFQAIKDKGLEIPEDVALVGFGNATESALLEIPLTVVDQPKEELGEKAAEILIEKLEHSKEAKLQQISIKPELIIRQSCRGGEEMQETVQETAVC